MQHDCIHSCNNTTISGSLKDRVSSMVLQWVGNIEAEVRVHLAAEGVHCLACSCAGTCSSHIIDDTYRGNERSEVAGAATTAEDAKDTEKV